MVQKKRLVVSYQNCPNAVLEAIKAKYPLGWSDAVIKVQKPNGDFFHAITVDLDDISYLVKVPVKIDHLTEEEFDKQFGSGSGDDMSDGSSGNDENSDNIAASSESDDE